MTHFTPTVPPFTKIFHRKLSPMLNLL